MAKSNSKQAPLEIAPQAKSAILNLIAGSDVPLKPAALIKLAGLPKKVTGKFLQATLQPELESGQIFNWGTEATHLYWHRGPRAEARERLMSLAASELLDEASLSKRAIPGPPELKKKVVADAFKDLITEGRFRVVTPQGTKKKQVVDLQHPEAYLTAEIERLLQSFGRQQLTGPIMALLSGKAEHEQPSASPAIETDVQEVAAKMFDAINRIAFSPGTTVTFYRLRQQPELAEIPKKVFDQAALLLEHERKVLLSLHDHAAALPPEEREQFVTDGLGTYYVSIYAR